MSEGPRSQALARLDVLVGEWDVVPEFGDGAPPPDVLARSTFEWALEGAFLVQRTEVPVPEAPDSLTIVAFDEASGGYRQHYYDSRGTVRLYAMTFDGTVWMLTRDAADFSPLPFRQRFTGTLDDARSTISGVWEKADAGSDWTLDFRLTYRRRG